MREATVASFQVKQSFWAFWDKEYATIKDIMQHAIPTNCAVMNLHVTKTTQHDIVLDIV